MIMTLGGCFKHADKKLFAVPTWLLAVKATVASCIFNKACSVCS